MAASTNPPCDLSGKKIRCWFVVGYAGLRDGVHYWRCMCRAHLMAEKILAERDILDRKHNTLSSFVALLRQAEENPIGWIYGEWTVIGVAGECVPEPPAQPEFVWKCRCVCGTERDIPRSALTSVDPRTLSCGCRPDAEVRAELRLKKQQARAGFNEAWAAAGRRSMERKFDNKWTRDMERALRAFQPSCVLCNATNDLTNGHVRPLSGGHGLEPGNVVTLCRSCNSFIHDRHPSQLSPRQARTIETAAAEFKEHWESECTTPRACTSAPADEILPTPDPALIALLRSVVCGEKTAITALANWLEEHGDHRANAIREMQRGRRWPDPSDMVREGLDLSVSEWETLKQYLGINPTGIAATIEEIAHGHGKQVQNIRNRIELALHKLTVPSPRGHCRG